MTKALPYYSFDTVYSYNATYNFIVGARGLGKTYGAKQRVIRNAIRKGEQFIYLRRYKTELPAFNSFFADIAHEFPDHDFKVYGSQAQMAPADTRDQKRRPWTTIGYAVALSNAQSKKSVAYPLVTTIIFDEFIIEKGAFHYLPNEAKAFNDLYSTVDRWKDKTKVLFLANSLSITNPYFLEYDIRPTVNTPIIRKADGFIVAHFPESAEFQTEVYKTKFGQFIKQTEYADYAVGSTFADNHDKLIGIKTSRAQYSYTLETRHGTFSVWIDWAGPYYYIQEKRPKAERVYTIEPNMMDEGKVLMLPNDKLLQYLRAAFRQGRAYFDDPKSRNAFIEIFRR